MGVCASVTYKVGFKQLTIEDIGGKYALFLILNHMNIACLSGNKAVVEFTFCELFS